MKKRFNLFLVFVFALVLSATIGTSAQANWLGASKKEVTITDVGEYTLERVDGQQLFVTFIPKSTGVYLMFVGDLTEGTSVDTVGVFVKNVGFRSDKNSQVYHNRYFEKGKRYRMEIQSGNFVNDKIKNMAGTVTVSFRKVSNRVQKLSVSKTVSLSPKDAKYEREVGIDAYEQYKNLKYSSDAWCVFKPKKTGYYRIYSSYYSKQLGNSGYNKDDGCGMYKDDYTPIFCNSKEVLKLKKGKTYYLSNFLYVGASDTKCKIKVQYISKKRTIMLYDNFPGTKNIKGAYDKYDVQKGSKMGLLLQPSAYLQPRYKFTGWYTKPKGGKKITANTKNAGKIKKLYAHWKKKK